MFPHPKNFSSLGVRTVMGGTKRNHARCTERNFPPFSVKLEFGQSRRVSRYLYSLLINQRARPLLLKRGRVKRIERKAIEFLYKFLRHRVERIWWPVAVRLRKRDIPTISFRHSSPLYQLARVENIKKYIRTRFFNFSSINNTADKEK